MDTHVGGWREQDTASPFVIQAAEEALRLISAKTKAVLPLSKIAAAKTQVVAGVNFQLVLACEGRIVKAKVHRSLKNDFSVLSYEFH